MIETYGPTYLSTCKYSYLKGLRITWHNKTVHLITHALQANINTQVFILTNACNLNNKPPNKQFPIGSLNVHAHKDHANAKLD